MPNFTNALVILGCARNAGVRHPRNENLKVGGHYHPAYTKTNGKDVAARWTGQFAINHKSYRDAAGNPIEVLADYIRVTAWSAKGNPNGLAESYARSMSIGMELNVNCGMKPFKSDIYEANVRLVKADGTPVQVEKMGFTVVPGSTMFIGESDKLIDTEIINKTRPPCWNIKGHADFATFKAICNAKNAEQYIPGKEMLGFAVVVLDKGAQANAYAGAAGAGLALPNAPLVEGFTKEAWQAKNPTLTDDVMLSTPQFVAFHAQIQAARLAGNQALAGYVNPGAQVVNTPAGGAFRNAY